MGSKGVTFRNTPAWLTSVCSVGEEPDWDAVDFRVWEERVLTESGLELPYRAVMREDGGDGVLAQLTGDGYVLVTHREFFGAVDAAVRDRAEVDSVETLVGKDGARVRVTWRLADFDRVGGELVRYAIVADNSYDGRTAMSVAPAGRLDSRDLDVRAPRRRRSYRHSGSVEGRVLREDADRALDDRAESYRAWRTWSSVPVGREALEHVLGRGPLGVRARRRIVHRFVGSEPSTAWGAFLAVSDYASKGVRARQPRALLTKQERAHAEALRVAKELT